MRADQKVIRAIEAQRVLSLVYGGRPIDLEPYTYGRMASGITFLLGWQRTGPFSTWRVLWLHRAQNIRATGEAFQAPRPSYDPVLIGSVAEVYAQVEGFPGPAVAKPKETA